MCITENDKVVILQYSLVNTEFWFPGIAVGLTSLVEILQCIAEIDPVELAKSYIAEGLSVNEAAKKAAKETNTKKSEIYKQLV